MSQSLRVRVSACAAVIGISVSLGCSSSDRQDSPEMAGSGPAVAVEAPQSSQAPAQLPAPPTVVEPAETSGASAPAVRMFIDPKTGETREPTQQELTEMARQQRDSSKAASRAAPKVLPNGAVMVPLDINPSSEIQACESSDGTLVVDHECRDGATPKASPKGDDK